MGVENDYVRRIYYAPRPGFERFYAACKAAWGDPKSWPRVVRDAMCVARLYKGELLKRGTSVLLTR